MTDDGGRAIALIPARGGSRRIPKKNVRPLAGHPVLAYTVSAALESGMFVDVVVSTNDEATAEIARYYGAEVPFMRPDALAGDLSPDIEWVTFTLSTLATQGRHYDRFALLRPTSPLRRATTIRRAFSELRIDSEADSLRAVERCRQHPGKMWILDGTRMRPLLDDGGASPPWHSTPYQGLPEVFVQNASLELTRTAALERTGKISGDCIRPFLCEEYEGFDLNDPADWTELERLIDLGAAELPHLTRQTPWSGYESREQSGPLPKEHA